MNEKTMSALTRNEFGKNESRRLRSSGLIPTILYSHGISETLSIPYKEFYRVFKGHISESVIFSLNIQGKESDENLAFVKD